MRVIMHVDLNCYFVSAERRLNKDLLNKPVVVASPGRRAVITTASYEARAKGIKAGMPVFKAIKLMDNLVVVPSNFELYVRTAKEFFDYITQNISSKIEVGSIDEAYVDITDNVKDAKDIKTLCERYIKNIKRDLNLPVSVGVSFCKLYAKMASEFNKPMGVGIVSKESLDKFVWDKHISKVYGVGEKTNKKLEEIGVNTIRDFIDIDDEKKLIPIFGKTYYRLLKTLRGEVFDEITEEMHELKSIGNETTLEYSTNDQYDLETNYLWLAENVSRRAINRNLKGHVVGIVIRHDDGQLKNWKTFTRQKKLSSPTNNYEEIKKHVLNLFRENYDNEVIRKVGVFLNDLVDCDHHYEQISLFDKDVQGAVSLMEKVNTKFNKEVVMKGTKLQQKIDYKGQNRFIESDRITPDRSKLEKMKHKW